jgi:hypothetical protein
MKTGSWTVPGALRKEAAAEIKRLRAELADHQKVSRTFRYGMDIDEWDKRAERLMETMLDGLTIGPTNRLTVKAVLAEHFADIASRGSGA